MRSCTVAASAFGSVVMFGEHPLAGVRCWLPRLVQPRAEDEAAVGPVEPDCCAYARPPLAGSCLTQGEVSDHVPQPDERNVDHDWSIVTRNCPDP